MRWSSSVNNQEEWYLYDASGERVLRRSYDGSHTTITVYAFGEEEHQYAYSGSGSSATNTSNTYYYDLGGQLMGTWDGSSSTTTFFLADTLGSVVSSFNNLPNGAAVVLGDQVYGPYGNQRTQQGTIGTSKGFTGQYNDWLTGLNYYGARYYDPVIGQFLSADVIQGNGVGMDPYSYVGDNPETNIDPTGQRFWDENGSIGGCFITCGFTIEPKITFPSILITPRIVYPTLLIFPQIFFSNWLIFPQITYPRLHITPWPGPEPRERVPGPQRGGGIAASTQSDGGGEPQPSIRYNRAARAAARKVLAETRARRKNERKDIPHTTISVGLAPGRTIVAVNEHRAPEGSSPDNLPIDDIAISVKAVVEELHPGAEFVGPDRLVPNQSPIKHAEDFILTSVPRGTLQGIGSSIDSGVCPRCQQAIGQLEPQVVPGLLDYP